MKQVALAAVVLLIVLALGALWFGGLLDDGDRAQSLDTLETDLWSEEVGSSGSTRESIEAPQDVAGAASSAHGDGAASGGEGPGPQGDDSATHSADAASGSAAGDGSSDGPRLLSHYLGDPRSTMMWATELTLVFDRPLQLVVLGKGPFEVDGSQARGTLWTIERRSKNLLWQATGEDGTSSSGTLTLAGVAWDELRAWIPEGFVALDDSETGDHGWATRVREPRSGIVFCLIPSGVAQLGGESGGGAMTAPKVVRFAEPFYMARTETTRAQWMAVRGTGAGTRDGDTYPVDSVTWNDAQSFCESIGARLPDNVQWEYACRAGTRTNYAFGDELTDAQAKFRSIDEQQGAPRRPREGSLAVEVASFPPNAWGLHDMHGNLSEWTDRASAERSNIDWGPIMATDPSGELRSMRGGNWTDHVSRLRSDLMQLERADMEHLTYVGFRACWVRR
jgi:formylglycine-generating enzyme required for sulfatase activity